MQLLMLHQEEQKLVEWLNTDLELISSNLFQEQEDSNVTCLSLMRHLK
jgi:hypothetical protein